MVRGFEVVLPPNVDPGAKIKVKAPDGSTVVATVPIGAIPGQKFRVGLPARSDGGPTQPQSPPPLGTAPAKTTTHDGHAHQFGTRGGLLDLAVQGDAVGIAAKLAKGADPNQIEDGWTPLAGAALRCDCACLEMLLDGGADPNQKFPQTGRTAAMICALMDVELGATVQLLEGTDPADCIHANDVSSASAYHNSMRRIVRKSSCSALHLLAKHGANLSVRDTGGDSVATLAAASADSEALALLCALGVDVARPNSRKETPLLLAAKRRSVGGVAVLLGSEQALQPERQEKAQNMQSATGIDLAVCVRGSQDLAAAPIRTLVELLCMAVQREYLPLCFLVLREASFQRAGRKKSVLELLRLEDSYGLTALQHASYLVHTKARKQLITLLTRVGADVCAELRVSRLDIPPVKKERGTSLAGAIWFNAHLSPDEAKLPKSSELLLQRLRTQAELRPEDWTVRALRATYGQVQNRTALHFAALRSTTDMDGTWARVLLEHNSPIVTDLFGNTALHIAAERLNVGAVAAILNAVSGTQDKTWDLLSLNDIVNMEDHMQNTPLDLLNESRNMLESTLSDNYCACCPCAFKSHQRRWIIFRRADISEALDEMFATCGGFAASSAKGFSDNDGNPIHSFTMDHRITKQQFEMYLTKVGVSLQLKDEVWQHDLAPTGSPDAARGLNKMNRSQFGNAVQAVGRSASVFHDYMRVCDLAGENTIRVIDLLATARNEGNTVQQRVDALLKDSESCEQMLLQHGAQPRSQRHRRHLIRRLTLCICSPFAFAYGSAVLATKPLFSTCQSLGELSAFPSHDEGHRRQQAAAAVFLVLLAFGCMGLPIIAATASDIGVRSTIAGLFRAFFILIILLTQLLGLWRVMSENTGFFPDPAAADGGSDPHLTGSGDNAASAELSHNTSSRQVDSTRMSTAALMAFKVPSLRYTELHGWWRHGEEGVKQAKKIKIVKVKTDNGTPRSQRHDHVRERAFEADALADNCRGAIHVDNPYATVQPRHTYLPVSARLWPGVPLFHNARFVTFQLVEVFQLASLPVLPPDPGKQEHKWVPAWFSSIGRFLRGFMIEFPEMEKMHEACFFGAVAFSCAWAFVCGYMMLGLISRQRSEMRNLLPAFSPDFLFRITWMVEFFTAGPCTMIVTKWLLRAADCTYLPEEQLLYYDLDRTERCFEGKHTFRASLGASLLILYTLTTANFAPSFIETWSDQKDIRVRPTFVAMSSFVKLLSVCVAVLATRIQWAMVLFPVLGSLVLLCISLRQPPTNISWADRLVASTYAALSLHSVCVALAWGLDITRDVTPCSTTEGSSYAPHGVEPSIECLEEDDQSTAEKIRMLPTLLHQVGLILLFTCCAGKAFYAKKARVEVVQPTESQSQEVRKSGNDDTDASTKPLVDDDEDISIETILVT